MAGQESGSTPARKPRPLVEACPERVTFVAINVYPGGVWRGREALTHDHTLDCQPGAHRLLVSLTQDRCLARLGLGARPVALTSAAHAGRVALNGLRGPGVALSGERLKRGMCCSK